MKPTFHSHSPEETIAFASRLAGILKPGDILCLCGDLGTGKTTFVKGLAAGLNLNPRQVNSPTFVLMNAYDGEIPLFHFDLYRIEGVELSQIGYEEYFFGKGVAVVEWAERMGPQMPMEHLRITFRHISEQERQITLAGHGRKWGERLKKASL